MHDYFCLTIDVDWAPDEAIRELADGLVDAGVRATWFVTHHSPILDELRRHPDLFELGVHPNFLPGSTHGDNPADVLAHVTAIVPEAVSMRSHSLAQTGPLLGQVAQTTGVRIDSNIFMPGSTCARPFTQETLGGTVHRVPFAWADDYWMFTDGRHPLPAPAPSAASVVMFHPIHVYLNSARLDHYAMFKRTVAQGADATEVAARFRSHGFGVRSVFLEAVRVLRGDGRAVRLRDVVGM